MKSMCKQRSGNSKTSGLTLVELLIGMLILGVLLAAINNVFSSSLGAASDVQARSELVSDAQIAEQIIAGRLKEAWYVFPPGTTLRMTSSGPTAQNPVTNSYDWTVNTHPIVAMILPPRSTALPCSSGNLYCYAFYAYYPVKRSGVAGTGAEKLNADSANDTSAWVMMEYLGYYSSSGAPSTLATAIPTGNSGNVLSDYVQPTTATTPNYSMFQYETALVPPSTTATYVSAVTINLRVARQARGRTLQLPPSGGFYSVTASPRNPNKVAP